MKTPVSSNIMLPPFKSEVVCAGFLEQGVAMENIKVTAQGAFAKSYRNDIEKIVIDDHVDDSKTVFEVFLNRDGIYDKLPEGFFHQTKGSKKVRTVQDAVTEHKQFKTEEKQARKFFAPIEKMLFQYRLHTELAEREALYDIQNGKLNKTFYEFWNLGEGLPEPEANRLLQMMPYNNFIKGNTHATTTALGFILHREVAFKTKLRSENGHLPNAPKMDACRLGMDTVLGTSHSEWLPVWEFTISGVSQGQLHQFVQEAPIGRLLQKFTEVFLPLEVEVDYQFDALLPTEHETTQTILGYGSRL